MNNVYPVTSTRRKGAERGRGFPSPYDTCTRILNSLTSKVAILMYVAIFSVLGNGLFAQKGSDSKSVTGGRGLRTTATTFSSTYSSALQTGVLCFSQTYNYASPAGGGSTGYDGTIYKFVVPNGVTSITIEAYGAEGRNAVGSLFPAGRGAYQKATFNVAPCQVLWILPGGQPSMLSNATFGDGGGGSFVTTGVGVVTSTALVVAGGGGGSGNAPSGGVSGFAPGGANANGQCTTSGGNAVQDGIGGTNGNGGNSATNPGANSAAGGGGFLSGGMNGQGASAFAGLGFASYAGGASGSGGGFGGGGGGTGTGTTGGGGGGYSGGAGADMNNGIGGTGGGGGSFIDASGINPVCNNTTLANTGNGRVVISYCYACPASVSVTNNVGGSNASNATTMTMCQASGGLFTLTAVPSPNNANTGNGNCSGAASNNNAPFEYGYQWFQNGVAMPGQTGKTLTLSRGTSGTNTYSVFVDCSLGTGPLSGAYTVTINPQPAASFGGATGGSTSKTICSGGAVTFTINVCNTTGGSFSVTVLNQTTGLTQVVNGVGTQTTFTPNPQPTQTTTYLIQMAQDNVTGCTGTSTACSGGSPTATATVNNGPIIANLNTPAPLCTGGTLVIEAPAGGNVIAPTYQWYKNGVAINNGPTGSGSTISGAQASTLTITNAQPSDGGLYYVQVCDVNFAPCNCTNSNVVNAVVNPLPTATYAPTSSLVCFGSTVCQNVNFTGTPPFTLTYQRQFSSGAVITQTVSGITATSTCISVPTNAQGTYTFSVVAVSDANCVNTLNNPSTSQVVVTGPFTISANTFGGIRCNGGTASASITPTGGVNTITYTLTGPVNSSTQGGCCAPVTFTGLTAGVYTVTAVNGNTAGCIATTSFTIAPAPSAVVINQAGTTNAVSCNGGVTSVTVRGSGGTGNLVYNLDNGFCVSPAQPNGATYTFTCSVSAGTHTIVATDANGCTSSVFTLTILPPSPVQATGTPGVNSLSCKGGTTVITANATGGANGTTYRYVLTGGPGSPINSGAGQGGTFTFTNVPASNCWQVTAIDVNGCVGTSTCIVITEPATSVAGTVTRTNATCNAGADGSVTVTGFGGTPCYTFNLEGPAAGQFTGFQPPNFNAGNCSGGIGTRTFGGLLPGTYTATVRDALNCVVFVGAVTITAPPAITGNVTASSIACNNGLSTVTISSIAGGNNTLPITYTITGITANNTVYSQAFPNNSTSDFVWPVGLPAGVYSVTASQSSCPSQAIGSNLTPLGNLVIGQPTAINVVRNFAPLTCNNSTTTVTLTVSGGSNTVTVQFINAATSNQMPGSPAVLSRSGAGTVTATFTNVPAGTYNWVVTDNNGCQVVSTTNPNTQVIVNPPSNVTITGSTRVNNTCFNGQAGSFQVNASGGTGSLTYVLQVPAGSTYAGPLTQTSVNPGSATFTGLPAGTYTVTVNDQFGCGGAVTGTVVTQPGQVLPPGTVNGAADLLLTDAISGSSFPTTSSCVSITYTITAKNTGGANIASQGVFVDVTKPASAYTLAMIGGSSTFWSQQTIGPTTDRFTLKNGFELSCSGALILQVNLCRNGSPVTSTGQAARGTVGLPLAGPQDINDFDNTRTHQYSAQ